MKCWNLKRSLSYTKIYHHHMACWSLKTSWSPTKIYSTWCSVNVRINILTFIGLCGTHSRLMGNHQTMSVHHSRSNIEFAVPTCTTFAHVRHVYVCICNPWMLWAVSIDFRFGFIYLSYSGHISNYIVSVLIWRI